LAPWYENATLSTKLEVHKLQELLSEEGRAMARACTKKLVKIDLVASKICEWTDRQLDRHTHHNTHPPGWGNKYIWS